MLRAGLLWGQGVTPAALGAEWAASIRALLEASALPTADLAESEIRFHGLTNGAELQAVVGLDPRGEVGLLRSLAVRPELRGHGSGSLLVRSVEAAARAAGMRQLWLLTTTAEGFFRRQGYGAVPRDSAPPALQATTEFRDICPASAVCMMKALT